jgi:hypothetical protein
VFATDLAGHWTGIAATLIIVACVAVLAVSSGVWRAVTRRARPQGALTGADHLVWHTIETWLRSNSLDPSTLRTQLLAIPHPSDLRDRALRTVGTYFTRSDLLHIRVTLFALLGGTERVAWLNEPPADTTDPFTPAAGPSDAEKITELSEQLVAARNELLTTEARLAAAQAATTVINPDPELRAALADFQTRLAATKADLDQALIAKVDLTTRNAALHNEIDRLNARAATGADTTLVDQLRNDLADATTARRDAESRAARAEEAQIAAEAALLQTQIDAATLTQTRAELAATQAAADEQAVVTAGLEQLLAEANTRVTNSAQLITALSAQVDRGQTDLAEANQALAAAETDLADARAMIARFINTPTGPAPVVAALPDDPDAARAALAAHAAAFSDATVPGAIAEIGTPVSPGDPSHR